jgi:hypothetical protein
LYASFGLFNRTVKNRFDPTSIFLKRKIKAVGTKKNSFTVWPKKEKYLGNVEVLVLLLTTLTVVFMSAVFQSPFS